MPSRSLASVVVDTTASPHARLRPVPVAAVRFTDRFWEPRLRRNLEVTLPSQYRRCEGTGRIDNFRRAAGKIQGPFQGRYYNDSDVYKWVEAASFALAAGRDPALEEMLATVVREIADAQGPDGYLNTYFTFERAGERWSNLRDLHELYCAGHLLQAAVAHRRCTGQEELLTVARRYADYICREFGPEGRNLTDGHQEIELALVELFRQTGERRYLEQARLFIERRGQQPGVLGGSPYHQDHAPFRTLDAVTGHAVRMLYYCCGGADLVAETGDAEYRAVLDRLWANLTGRRMYVTGGVGSRWEGEAFGADYELPNDRAYAESCAAIAAMMWAWRMLLLTGEAQYTDVLENALFNGILPSLSLDGELYFYQNPLADNGGHRRQPWFECACCPPNIARLLAELPGYVYTTSEEGVWTHLYAAGEASIARPDGVVTLRQQTDYPWSGEVEIAVHGTAGPFTLYLRVPGWARGAILRVNDEPRPEPPPGTYAAIVGIRPGDTVRLALPMEATRLVSHPYVPGNAGRVALRRGPLVYCVEQVDLAGRDPREVALPDDTPLSATWEEDLLGGVVTLSAEGVVRPLGAAWGGNLYRELEEVPTPAPKPLRLKAIPYYAWANRDPGGMAVWLARD